MFFVINKDKIKAYIVSLSTVAILLVLSIVMQSKSSEQSIKTSGAITQLPILSVETTEKEVALSINCNKNMDNISDILDTLSKMKAKATFFITGEIADKYPEEIKKIINNGNEIGSMSDTYINLKEKKIAEVQEQIKSSKEKIAKLTSKEVNLFRAPYGEYSEDIVSSAQKLNLTTIGWNIDTLDYNKSKEQEIITRIDNQLSNREHYFDA